MLNRLLLFKSAVVVRCGSQEPNAIPVPVRVTFDAIRALINLKVVVAETEPILGLREVAIDDVRTRLSVWEQHHH